MFKGLVVTGMIAMVAPVLAAQDHARHNAPEPKQAPETAGAAGDGKILPVAQQIAGAVLAAPEESRAAATVLGYDPDGKLVTIRKASNDMICLADDPKEARFHVACYHGSLEPFMARGRELTAHGITGFARDSTRNADVMAGRVKMPAVGALYTLTARSGCFDPAAGTLCDRVNAVHSVYVPYATTASTGLPDHPVDEHTPFLMSPGTPRAHIMFGTHEH